MLKFMLSAMPAGLEVNSATLIYSAYTVVIFTVLVVLLMAVYRNTYVIRRNRENKAAEKALHESERSKAVLLASLPGMAYRCRYDRDWTMEFVSEGCFELTGYQPDSLINSKELTFNDLILKEYRDTLWQEWERVVAQKTRFRYEYEITTASGEQKWVLEMGQAIYNESGNVEALEGIIIDISTQKKREAQIRYISEHDYLTRIYNREYYEKMLLKLNSPEYLPLSVMIMNINGVHMINDAFGRTEGDRLIKECSRIIQECCRFGDVPARIAGDEFGIIMPRTGADEAYQMLLSIMKACASYNGKNPARHYEASFSCGYSTKESVEENLEDNIKEAYEYLHNRKLLNSKSSHSAIVSSIMAAIYEKSQETEEHAKRLAILTRRIGEKLSLSQKSLGDLELLAMLHDIGKVSIDGRILNKPGKLTDDEWLIMKKHAEIGYRIAKSSSELEPIAEYILSHHERWDGTGYPQNLKGEHIPLLSRIIAVADAYDAMTENRVYRKAMTKEDAVEEIRRNAGTQFDPEIVRIFIESI